MATYAKITQTYITRPPPHAALFFSLIIQVSSVWEKTSARIQTGLQL